MCQTNNNCLTHSLLSYKMVIVDYQNIVSFKLGLIFRSCWLIGR